jgi:hypothetical protein
MSDIQLEHLGNRCPAHLGDTRGVWNWVGAAEPTTFSVSFLAWLSNCARSRAPHPGPAGAGRRCLLAGARKQPGPGTREQAAGWAAVQLRTPERETCSAFIQSCLRC